MYFYRQLELGGSNLEALLYLKEAIRDYRDTTPEPHWQCQGMSGYVWQFQGKEMFLQYNENRTMFLTVYLLARPKNSIWKPDQMEIGSRIYYKKHYFTYHKETHS